ncbi:MAG: hypothetical protein ABSH22_17970 [Tepidisphaeraceae bacterium]
MAQNFDSSITRLRPFFQPLLRRDPSGLSWLPALLRMGQANPAFAREIAHDCGPLLPWVTRQRTRPDRALRTFGIESVALEACFEYRLPPPREFLQFLITHPHLLSWPREDDLPGPNQRRREELLGHHGFAAARAAAAEALAELERVGAAGSNGKWWAFEGFTHADCLLETPALIVLIEGKRTEKLSASTRWFPQRNQLLRSLEVARAVARQREKEFAVILLAEDFMDGMSIEEIFGSLPHLTPRQRSEILDRYLGCVTWRQALAEIFFPNTVEDAAMRIRQSSLWEMPLAAPMVQHEFKGDST